MNFSVFPACNVGFPHGTEYRRASFYLAAEEYIVRRLPKDNYIFSWQLNPTVVIGRNQVLHQEINLDFCRSEGIDIIRRKSGGGAIFADRNNIMWSLITDGGAVEPLFQEYAESLAGALRTLGVDVEVSGRNDITIAGGGKICGNAFYHLAESNIVHGTMLYDTNPRLMLGALTPTMEKLAAKGVKSVRSRVKLLKDYLPYSVTELRKRLGALLCNRSVCLTGDDIRAIEEMEKGYFEPSYLYGHTMSDIVRAGRIKGCGSLQFGFQLKGALIEQVHLTGDFFELADAQKAFQTAFAGLAFTPQTMEEAIERTHPEHSVRNLDAEPLLRLLTGKEDGMTGRTAETEPDTNHTPHSLN